MADLSLGIDIGGTFTDIVIYDPGTGRHHIWKEPTTPGDPAEGVIAGTKRLLATGAVAAKDIARVVHATTLFTNALIERKGARTGLITTAGFRDVLEIGRERKFELYDIFIEMPEPLVPRSLRREVAERLDQNGALEVPLDEAALMDEVEDLVERGVVSIAIVFLHSYANPAHENAAARAVAARYPDISLTTSAEVAPEIREFERTSTTVVNAFVKPLADTYLDSLVERIRELEIDGPFSLMLSNGGLTHLGEAKRRPVQLLESGPAAGALAGAFFGSASGETEVLAFDMGGTTAKISLIDGGEPSIAYGFEAARTKRFAEGSGLPIKISTIELIEVGAGGGSIARVDELGLLKVGPESSGAEPGPACYAKGGDAPTVTDADLLLGYLNADYFLGGAMAIDRAAAEAAMGPLMATTGLDLNEVAWGIHDVVNETMAAAARVQITQRGKDPRDYAMLATGGAGPVHAYNVARKLNLRTLVCPPAAGVGSVIGLLMAPARVDRVGSMVSRLDGLDWDAFEALYKALEDDARAVLEGTAAELDQLQVHRLADMRYVGQDSEVVVGLGPGPFTRASNDTLVEAFEETYRQLFTRTRPGIPIQVVNLRVSLSAPVKGGGMEMARSADVGEAALKGRRAICFGDPHRFVETNVYDRYRVAPGEVIEGPVVFEEKESTLIIGPGACCRVQADGTLIVTLPADGD
jgi:N-methylhydantoinase A